MVFKMLSSNLQLHLSVAISHDLPPVHPTAHQLCQNIDCSPRFRPEQRLLASETPDLGSTGLMRTASFASLGLPRHEAQGRIQVHRHR